MTVTTERKPKMEITIRITTAEEFKKLSAFLQLPATTVTEGERPLRRRDHHQAGVVRRNRRSDAKRTRDRQRIINYVTTSVKPVTMEQIQRHMSGLEHYVVSNDIGQLVKNKSIKKVKADGYHVTFTAP